MLNSQIGNTFRNGLTGKVKVIQANLESEGKKMNEFVQVLLPVTAGGFIYIAGSDLIPELHSEEDWKSSAGQLFFLIAGIGMMYLVKLFIH